MFRFLKQPYPLRLDAEYDLKNAFLISLFVFLFLLVFQPFGLSTIEPELKYLLIIGFSGVCFLFLLINLLIIPKILKNVFNEGNWTVLKRIMWCLWIVFTIGIGNYLFTWLFDAIFDFYRLGFDLFIFIQLITLLIAVFPITVYTILSQIYLLRENLKAAEEISAKLRNSELSPGDMPGQDQKVILVSENRREKCEFHARDLLFISSEGNYVEIFLKNEKIKSVLLRNSLRRIEEQLENYPFFFRCHRAYIVNIKKIIKATGNAQGFKLTLKEIDQKIPVARRYTKEFKKTAGIS
ncbi:MAG: LytTR family transcriptional regulator DNA-binding domain-containing protein [Candidatus Aminicenantes bacterium]|nr:LytTR family transcriptional regulator DNA-binding domain-containing protein [Candidatus Aminicenantes bacterium]